MDDRQAVDCLKNGDIGGLEFLVNRYQTKAVHMAFLVTRDEQTAEDAVQEAFLRIYDHIHHFDEGRLFEPYLMGSVIDAAIDIVEKHSKWLLLVSEDDLRTVKGRIVCASQTDDEADYHQLKKDIYQALVRLSPRQRAVIVQRYYLEMSEHEMADPFSVVPYTIQWLLNNARKHLRDLLSLADKSTK